MNQPIPNTTLRIFLLIKKRRKISEQQLAEMLGLGNNTSAPYLLPALEKALNFLDAVGSDDDLYCCCRHCGVRNPFDSDHQSPEEEEADTIFCEFCGKDLFGAAKEKK